MKYLIVGFLVVSCGVFKGTSFLDNTPIPEERSEPFVGEEEALESLTKCRAKLGQQRNPVESPKRLLIDGPYRWETIPFDVQSNWPMRIRTTIILDFNAFLESAREAAINRVARIFECVKKFYLTQGLELAIDLRISTVATPSSIPSNAVVIRPQGTRPTTFNMNNWAFEMGGDKLSDSHLCTVISHEIGHMLGLRDEYYDCTVAGRKMGEHDSLMNVCVTDSKNVRLYYRHLKTILKGVCQPPVQQQLEVGSIFVPF